MNCEYTFSNVFRLSPPYHTYALELLNFFAQYSAWVAVMTLCYKITPPNVLATVVALLTAVLDCVGE